VPRSIATAVAMPVQRRVQETVHCGMGDRVHCGAAVQTADRMGHQTALWTVRRIAAEMAEGITRGAQEGEMSPVGQAALLTAVGSWPRLAIFFTER